MKYLLLLSVLFSILICRAQIIPEHTYDGYGVIAHLEFQDDKYAILDAANNRCRLYNPDHSLYKTVNLPVPAGNTLNSIQYVTDGLFNTDTGIEISYTYFMQSGSSYVYENRVANETGQILVTIAGASTVMVDHLDDSWKYVAWIYDYSSYPYEVDTKYFSLPGHMVTSTDEEFTENRLKVPFPNPSSDLVTLSYKLNPGMNSQMLISNAGGQIVKTVALGSDFENVTVPLTDYHRGFIFILCRRGQVREDLLLT